VFNTGIAKKRANNGEATPARWYRGADVPMRVIRRFAPRGRALPAGQDHPVRLLRLRHTFVFRVDLRSRQDCDLRLEMVEAAGAKGQAKFVDGR
jgi:hypothetical protein